MRSVEKFFVTAVVLLAMSPMAMAQTTSNWTDQNTPSPQFTLRIPLELELAENPAGMYEVRIRCSVFNRTSPTQSVGYGQGQNLVAIDTYTGKNRNPEAVVKVNVNADKDPREVNSYTCDLSIGFGGTPQPWQSASNKGPLYYDPAKPFVGRVMGTIDQPRL